MKRLKKEPMKRTNGNMKKTTKLYKHMENKTTKI